MTLVTARDIVLYRGSHRAVSASSFTIPEGKITAVIGPNGSGKTTLLRLISGELAPDDGGVTVPPPPGANGPQCMSPSTHRCMSRW